MIVFAAMVLASTVGQAEVAEKKDADPTICRREAPVGSRVPGRRTCMKRSQWVAKSTKVDQEGRAVPEWQGKGFSPSSN